MSDAPILCVWGGAEGNNTFRNDAGSGTFVSVAAGAAAAVIKNNIFSGPGTITNQSTAVQNNNFAGDPGFVNAAAYDYHLTSGSPAIDKGTDPGSDGSFSLSPVFQYVHPACAEGRSTIGLLDIGAYEFGGGTSVPPPGGTCGSPGAKLEPPLMRTKPAFIAMQQLFSVEP